MDQHSDMKDHPTKACCSSTLSSQSSSAHTPHIDTQIEHLYTWGSLRESAGNYVKDK